MADQIPVTAPAPEPVQNTAPENPHLENVTDPGVAPGLDQELDNALEAAFKDTPKNEPKPVEKVKEDKKQTEKSELKEDKKQEPEKPQGELPSPESLDNDPPKKQQGWTALKNSYKQAHKVLEQKEEEIRKLKSGLAEKASLSTKEVEALKNEVKELSKYRSMIDIQADPEFVSKFDQPITNLQSSIKDIFIGLDVKKEIVDQIDFSNTKLMDEIINNVGEHRDKITSRKLQRKVEEMLDLVDKRDETLSSQKTSYTEFMEKRKKESSMKGAEEEGRTIKHLEAIAAAKDKSGGQLFPFLNKVEPKEGATEPEIAQAATHNKLVDLMTQKINNALKLNSPEERAEVVVAAVASHYLIAQLKSAAAKIKSLEEEIKKISQVGDPNTPRTPKPTSNGNPRDMDLDSALKQHFSR